ncbi:uncharacterized protein LOC131627366 [Vicia villosa]|uniref:uncharacterized protein LOC131627366 n=1 Tax=Vicia villosa TaxID=3911 RepID=UPI00273AA329|nr:uncharacterized protein LOC131627366 [Vicia villosa]
MGKRGRPPRRQVVQTPPASVRVFSPTSSSHGNGNTSGGTTISTEVNTLIGSEPILHTIPEEEKEHSEEPPQPWVDVIKGNRTSSSGLNIEYTPPSIVNGEIEVVLEDQDVVSELKFWENALIMYVVGGNLTMTAVRKFMMKTWDFAALPELYYNEEGYFIIKMRSKEDKDVVLRKGPYTIFRQPMFLQEWRPYFSLDKDAIRVMPLWVTFPQLPLAFWGESSIGKVASAIGKPIMTDECTAKKLRITYARVLIEVDITAELKEAIYIRDPQGNRMQQQVEYEWKPAFCRKCNKGGHDCEKLNIKKAQMTQKWVQKHPADGEIANSKPKPAGGEIANSKPKPTNGGTEDDWKIVTSNSRIATVKGKAIRIDTVGHNEEIIGCSNGFDILGMEDGKMVDAT